MPDSPLSTMTAKTAGVAALLYGAVSPYASGDDRKVEMTAAGAVLLEAANAAAQRTALGLGTAATQNLTVTGGGTLATGGFTLTVPATGTAALLGTANVFVALQTIAPSTPGSCLTLTSGTVTTSLPMLTGTQTWNAGGVTFVGQDYTFTKTAAATGSLMARWATTGRGTISFEEGGEILIGSSGGAGLRTGNAGVAGATGTTIHVGCTNGGVYLGGTGTFGADVLIHGALSKMAMRSALVFGWSSDNMSYGTMDLLLYRAAAASLQLGTNHATAATAQTIKAHNVTTGTGASMTIAGGTGSTAGGAVILAASATTGAPVTGLTVGAGGTLGFYTTAPIALQTGVAVSAAGIHAALVNLGLITA